jgi:CRP-like cAMP-binding protein
VERALASPLPGRIGAWKKRVRSDLVGAVTELEKHRESAEKPGGVLAELEILLGRPAELRRITDEHALLMERAGELTKALDNPSTSGDVIRTMAAKLTELIRAHQAREADLILAAFQRDIGVGD